MIILTALNYCDCGQDLDELWDMLNDGETAQQACQLIRKCDLCKEYIIGRLDNGK